MALVCFITFIFQVIKMTSDVTLTTLTSTKQKRLTEMQMYLKRQAKLIYANLPPEEKKKESGEAEEA